MTDDSPSDAEKTHFTLALVEQCVRNTMLETLHAGIVPASRSGDFSDVKVVTPYGEIAWRDLSRISDDEMKALMIEVTNKVFTFLTYPEDLARLGAASRWNKPQIDPALSSLAAHRRSGRANQSKS